MLSFLFYNLVILGLNPDLF